MKPATVYLAGCSHDAARVRHYADALERAGIAVTDRWFDTAHEWAGQDATRDPQTQATIAEGHLTAILFSSALWWLYYPQKSGSWVEAGIALGVGVAVVVSGPGCDDTLFSSLAGFRSVSDQKALAELVRRFGR